MNLNTIRVWWSTWQKVPKEKNRRRPTSPAGRGHPCHFLIRVSIFCPNPASTRFTRGLTNITHRLKETSTTDQQGLDRRNNLQKKKSSGEPPRVRIHQWEKVNEITEWPAGERVRVQKESVWWCYLNHCFWRNKTLSPEKPKPLAAARPVVFSLLSLFFSLSLSSSPLFLGFSQLFDLGLKPSLPIQIRI